MNAEQLTTTRFSLSPQYEQETTLPRESVEANSQERQFSLNFSFRGINSLIERFGKERGIFQAVLGVMLNIWSLRQEMLGEMDARELITLISQDRGKFKFKNDLYGQAQDLEEMYLTGADHVSPVKRDRYIRESKQAIGIFESLSKTVSQVDFSLPADLLKAQLELNGFREQEIDVSPSMIANVGSLRDQIQNVDDLHRFIQGKPKIKAMVGPTQLMTVSPPHWSHHRGETGFVWMSEAVVLPQTKEAFIRQSGKFGKTRIEDLLSYLAYFEPENHEFSSEAEIMNFISVVMETEYRQPKAVLDFLVEKLGKLKPAGKIDKNVASGSLDIRPYFNTVHQLFEFEYQHGLDNSQNIGVVARLNDLSDLMKHQIARNQPKALLGILSQYKMLLSEQPNAPTHNFLEQLRLQALNLDKGFGVKIDFSLLDCVAGTPFSLMNPGNLSQLQLNMPTSLNSRAQLEAFCNKYHAEGLLSGDASQYSTRGTCRMCGKDTFVWSTENGGCNVCPLCEANDNLKHAGDSDADGLINSDYSRVDGNGNPESGSRYDLTKLVASTTIGEKAL